MNDNIFLMSSSACGGAPLTCVWPLRWDEDTWTETAHISAGEGESWRNYCGWSCPRVQGLAVWPWTQGHLHTLSAGTSAIWTLTTDQVLITGQELDLKCGWCFVGVFFLQENLKRLRDSITRRHKEREKTGKDLGRIIWTFIILNIWNFKGNRINIYFLYGVNVIISHCCKMMILNKCLTVHTVRQWKITSCCFQKYQSLMWSPPF